MTDRVQAVQDLVLEMKDTSELMVDLAYSSVFYDSDSIAKEVVGLEETVGEYLTELQRQALEAVREGELPIDHAIVLLRVAQGAEVIANSAMEIADMVLRDVEMHPVLQQAIHESDSMITKVSIAGTSSLVGRTLGELELETETGMRVLAVKRRGRWKTGVDGAFKLEADDLMVASGPLSAEEEFLALAG